MPGVGPRGFTAGLEGPLRTLYAQFLQQRHLTVFFFKQKTAYEVSECDWSSDVCSSDLAGPRDPDRVGLLLQRMHYTSDVRGDNGHIDRRSEERRVGKECRL